MSEATTQTARSAKQQPRKAKFLRVGLKRKTKQPDLSATLGHVLQLPEGSINVRTLCQDILSGFEPQRMNAVKDYLQLDDREFSRYTLISHRTLTRRKQTATRLTPSESDRLYRLAKLAALATDLFEGNRDAANTWLKSPNQGLGGETPLDMAETNPGYEEVTQLIGQLEHGVF